MEIETEVEENKSYKTEDIYYANLMGMYGLAAWSNQDNFVHTCTKLEIFKSQLLHIILMSLEGEKESV